ncbi:MAG: hypothetical protein ACLFU7_04255 [Armatimonadota bacterium]
MRATPGNHTHKQMPEQRAQLDLNRTLSDTQYEALIQGVIPRSQEDRWFAFEDDDWFSLCRSWTGNCIFRVRLQDDGDCWRIAEAWVNRDPEQYASEDEKADALILSRLLDSIIAANAV